MVFWSALSLGHHLFPPILPSVLEFPVTYGICLPEAILWLSNWLLTCVVQACKDVSGWGNDSSDFPNSKNARRAS